MEKLKFELNLAQTNVILSHLSNGAHKDVSELIAEIVKQAQAQLKPQVQPTHPSAQPAPGSAPANINILPDAVADTAPKQKRGRKPKTVQ